MAHGERVCPGCGQLVVGHVCPKMVTLEHWESNSVLRRKQVQFEGQAADLRQTILSIQRWILGGVQEILIAPNLERAKDVAKSMKAILENFDPVDFPPVVLRRLEDGRKAMALPEPKTQKKIAEQIPVIEDGIRALQSLDDLGKEANKKACNDMDTLTAKLDRLRKKEAKKR